MIIIRLVSGLGNQLFQYATARSLALRLGTELKFDLSFYEQFKQRRFQLDLFNVEGSIATPEEIERIKKIHPTLGKEPSPARFMPEIFSYPDDVHLDGYYGDERYFLDIADQLRAEITLKYPPSEAAKKILERIEAAECSVSIHIRHGDFVVNRAENYRGVLPLEYYYDCINELRKNHERLTVFAFSDDLPWVKKYFRPSAAVEYVEGTSDVEELLLMSRCRHNITANSTFSWWGAWLNGHADKKIFRPNPYNMVEPPLPPPDPLRVNNPNSIESWIRMPVDWSLGVPKIEHAPVVSVILAVGNDERRVGACLQNILDVDFEYYEVIVIDDASDDDTFKICREYSARSDKINLLRTTKKIGRSAALNRALEWASGEFIVFADVNGFMLANALKDFYSVNIEHRADVLHSTNWFVEDSSGPIAYRNKRFQLRNAPALPTLNGRMHFNANIPQRLQLLATNGINHYLGSNMYRWAFLLDNGIKFNGSEDAEYIFWLRSLLEAKDIFLIPQPTFAALKS